MNEMAIYLCVKKCCCCCFHFVPLMMNCTCVKKMLPAILLLLLVSLNSINQSINKESFKKRPNALLTLIIVKKREKERKFTKDTHW